MGMSELRRAALIAIFQLFSACVAVSQGPSARIQELYANAQTQEKSGQIDKAIESYLEILKADSKLAAGYNNLGRLYYQQGRLDEGSKFLKRACDLDPKLEPPRALLGFALFQMGDFLGARRELKLASQLDPHDVNARLFLARAMVELKDLNGAQKLLEQIHQEDPKNTEALYTLGTVYSTLAESTIGEIQTADPNSYLIEVLLGSYSEIKKSYEDAAEHYKRAIQKAPDIPDLYYRYAHALWIMGDAQNAIHAYKQALELNPYDYQAAWEEARAVLHDNPEEAVRLSTRALELKPSNVDALVIRARGLLSLQKPEEAVRDLKAANALNSEDPAIHFQLAKAYRQLGLAREALAESTVYERLDQASHEAKSDR